MSELFIEVPASWTPPPAPPGLHYVWMKRKTWDLYVTFTERPLTQRDRWRKPNGDVCIAIDEEVAAHLRHRVGPPHASDTSKALEHFLFQKARERLP